MDTVNTVLIKLTGVAFNYPSRPPLLDGIEFTLKKDERVGFIGSNGCGKTTLFHIIMGLLKPQGGDVEIFGRACRSENDFLEAREKIGLLFQDSDDQLFCPTVEEDVAFGPLNLRKTHDEAKTIVTETLDSLGLNGFERRITYHLSGGEKRLVSLATILAMKPKVLLLDEPTTVLDESATKRIEKILVDSHMSCIIISHDMAFLEKIVHRTYRLDRGKIHQVA